MNMDFLALLFLVLLHSAAEGVDTKPETQIVILENGPPFVENVVPPGVATKDTVQMDKTDKLYATKDVKNIVHIQPVLKQEQKPTGTKDKSKKPNKRPSWRQRWLLRRNKQKNKGVPRRRKLLTGRKKPVIVGQSNSVQTKAVPRRKNARQRVFWRQKWLQCQRNKLKNKNAQTRNNLLAQGLNKLNKQTEHKKQFGSLEQKRLSNILNQILSKHRKGLGTNAVREKVLSLMKGIDIQLPDTKPPTNGRSMQEKAKKRRKNVKKLLKKGTLKNAKVKPSLKQSKTKAKKVAPSNKKSIQPLKENNKL